MHAEHASTRAIIAPAGAPTGGGPGHPGATGEPDGPDPPIPPREWSTVDRVVGSGIGALTVGWFTTSWQLMGKPVLDAVGDTAGGVCTVLLGLATAHTLFTTRR